MNVETIVDDYIRKKKLDDDASHKKVTGLINASMLGQCRRRQFYAIKKIEQTNPPDARMFRVFCCGDIFHTFIQNILVKSTTGLPEMSFKDDTVSCRVDFVDDDSVYEFKSMHSRAFWYMQGEIEAGKTIFEMKPDHCLQVCLGARCFNKKIAHLVYISKDDLCIKQFTLNVEEIGKELDKELADIQAMLYASNLPSPEPKLYGVDKKTGKPKECTLCCWYTRCKTEECNLS